MATRSQIVEIIHEIFKDEISIPVSIGEVKYQQIIDEEKGIFELKIVGWNGSKNC